MVMYHIDYDNLPPACRFFRLDKCGIDCFHNIGFWGKRKDNKFATSSRAEYLLTCRSPHPPNSLPQAEYLLTCRSPHPHISPPRHKYTVNTIHPKTTSKYVNATRKRKQTFLKRS